MCNYCRTVIYPKLKYDKFKIRLLTDRFRALFFQDVRLARDESVFETDNVWAFDFKYIWLTLIALLVLYLIPVNIWWKIPFAIITIWYGSYSFRQNWRLILTNKRIIARRIYPRPLSYFLTKVHNFPYKHLEGLSTGPRNNVGLFLVGVFLAAHLGINILKSSLSVSGLELPDTLEFIIFLMELLPPFRDQGTQLQQEFELWYQQFAQDILTFVGFTSLITGVILILISFPWKQFLVLRVRYGSDFKIRTSVSKKFIQQLYSRFYNRTTEKIPKRFEKWHFPWLADEKVEGIADMEQIQYLNRIIGTFALITGSVRVWIGARDLSNFNSTEFILWMVVAGMDIIVIVFSIKFSKRESEFVITNQRIIFAQEVKQISGLTGQRYFFLSDLKRNDIASFDFRKVTSFALEYLIAAIAVTYTAILLLNSNAAILAAIFGVLALFLFAFVNQTYVGFSLKTKSGDSWVMRHQLANPATRLRQFVGDEQGIFARLLANRLEEKEIINAVQQLRTHQTGLKAQRFEDMVERNIQELSSDNSIDSEFTEDNFVRKRFVSKRFTKRRRTKRIQLSLEDILLKNEKVIWEKIIPYPLNWRFISMFVGTVVFILALPTVFFVSVRFEIDPASRSLDYLNLNPGITVLVLLASIVLYLIFQLKYFSLRRKSIVISKDRVFYEEIVRPPKWLFFIGIFRESYIRESMVDQLQVIGSGKYVIGGYNWDKFIGYLKETVFRSIIYFIVFHLYLLSRSYWNYLPASNQISNLLLFVLFSLGMMITWSASNMIVQLIQSWPTLELNASGIGVEFRLPYLTQPEAEEAQYALWSGVGPEEKFRQKIMEQKQLREKRKKKEDTLS